MLNLLHILAVSYSSLLSRTSIGTHDTYVGFVLPGCPNNNSVDLVNQSI